MKYFLRNASFERFVGSWTFVGMHGRLATTTPGMPERTHRGLWQCFTVWQCDRVWFIFWWLSKLSSLFCHACPLVDLCTVWHWRRRQCAMSNIIWIFFTTTQDGLCRKYRGGALDSLISRQYIQKTWSTKPIKPWRLHTVAVFSRNRLVINKMIKAFLLVHHAKTWMPPGGSKINSRTFIVGLLWTFDDKTLSRQIYLKVKLIVAAFYLICKSSELKGKDQKEKI